MSFAWSQAKKRCHWLTANTIQWALNLFWSGWKAVTHESPKKMFHFVRHCKFPNYWPISFDFEVWIVQQLLLTVYPLVAENLQINWSFPDVKRGRARMWFASSLLTFASRTSFLQTELLWSIQLKDYDYHNLDWLRHWDYEHCWAMVETKHEWIHHFQLSIDHLVSPLPVKGRYYPVQNLGSVQVEHPRNSHMKNI